MWEMKDFGIEKVVYRLIKLCIFISLRAILAPIIIDAIISIFYKIACSAELVFNLLKANFFISFYLEMLICLFAMIHYKINKYQSDAKVVIPVDEKIAQTIYFNINYN